MQDLVYKNSEGISQSMIKSWRYMSPKKWHKKYIENAEDDDEDKNPAFILGNLLDTLLFTPDLLDARFYISKSSEKLPSEAVQSIVNSVYQEIIRKNAEIKKLNQEGLPEEIPEIDISLEANSDLILIYADSYINDKGEKGWCSNWKSDTRIASIIKQGANYFECLRDANNRQIITSELNMQAIELVEILRKDKWCRQYLVNEDSEVELQFQVEIFAEYNGIPIKGALDIRRVDHRNKTVQIADFKKAFSSHQFIDNIKKYSYGDQLAFYIYLHQLQNEYPDYEILLPINIVIDISDKVPYIYSYNDLDLKIAKYGNLVCLPEMHPYMRIKKGFLQILEEISWHMTKNDWSCPREMIENGFIPINLLNM